MQAKQSATSSRLSRNTRRELLVRAAADTFAEHGYNQSTLRDIAGRAGVTTPILYRFFDSKFDLYRVIIEEAAGTLIGVWSSVPAAGSPEDFFRASTSAFFSWIEQHRQAWRLLFADQPRDPSAEQVLQQVRSAADDAMGEVLRAIGVNIPAGFDEQQFLGGLASQVTGAGNALASWWWFNQEVSAADVAAMNHVVLWQGLKRVVAGTGGTGTHTGLNTSTIHEH